MRPRLLGPNGQPISSSMFKKEDPPATGPAYGGWSGDSRTLKSFLDLIPGASVTQFNLSLLTLEDFRNMRAHPSVNTALSILAFMQHQSAWKIVHDDKKVVDECTQQLENVWTQLSRTMAQANWAGYSPAALEWENDVDNRAIVLDKIKDLIPENCAVNWKEIEGKAGKPGGIKPKFQIYDGIKQFGQPDPIPVENTFWYPLLMENGDYSGRRLLEAAFTPWYFSMLLHVYANRYYERFGEPTAIGRAPFDEAAPAGAENNTTAQKYMMDIMQNLRSRGVVVLPGDGRQDSGSGKFVYDYDISFLESQMRGADFERYMTRLDEEISLALFTPTLLFRVADVGSYNLGQGHMQVYLWMMNRMNSDRAEYINRYILDPIMNFNFSKKGPRPKIVFKKLGDTNSDLIQSMITAMLNNGTVKPDLEALGDMAGMKLTAVKPAVTPTPTTDPGTEGAGGAGAGGAQDASSNTSDSGKPAAKADAKTKAGKDRDGVITAMLERVRAQVARFKSTDSWKDLDFGFKNSLVAALKGAGSQAPEDQAAHVLAEMSEYTSYLAWDELDVTGAMELIELKLRSLVYAA